MVTVKAWELVLMLVASAEALTALGLVKMMAAVKVQALLAKVRGMELENLLLFEC